MQSLLERFGNEKFKVGEDDDGYPVKLKLKYFFKVGPSTTYLSQ